MKFDGEIQNKENSDLPEPSPVEKAFINEYLALSTDGILIKKDSVTTRMFSMVGGSTIVAFVFGELADSFIVGLPATMLSNNGTISAKTIAPVPMMRLYKHQFGISAMPIPRYLLCYLSLCEPILDSIPGFFDEARKTQVKSLISALTEIVQRDAKPVEVQPPRSAQQNGTQSKEFIQKIMEMADPYEKVLDSRLTRSRNLKH